VSSVEAEQQPQQQELERLRARVAALEEELVEVQARANAAVAAAQERAYWLDRWHVDLNALMEKPGAAEFRGLLRAIRAVVRLFKRVKRALL
jgi:predicted  nucleic acid-binding Zn-ribbon protein